MGRAKQAMMEREGQVNGVLSRHISAGAVSICEMHDYPIDEDNRKRLTT